MSYIIQRDLFFFANFCADLICAYFITINHNNKQEFKMDDRNNPDPPTGTTIQDLPTDALLNILQWIPKGSLEPLQNVCSLWHALIDEWFGRLVTTSSRMMVHPSNPSVIKGGLDLISEIGVWGLHIDDENLLEYLPSPLPSFKRPHLLRLLHVESPIHPDLFGSLTSSGTTNLSTLKLQMRNLTDLRIDDMTHLSINFPKLKELEVETVYYQTAKDVASLNNLRRLLEENNFENLEKLLLQFPVESDQDVATTKVLIPFIQRHPSLEKLCLQFFLQGEIGPSDTLPQYEEAVNGILIGIENQERCCPSLKALEIMAEDSQSDYPLPNDNNVWQTFISNVKSSSLEELMLNIGPLSNETMAMVCSRNASTLQKINISQGHTEEDGGISDLSVFASLQCISELFIDGSEELSGASALPISLEKIFLSGSFITAEDVGHILLRMPNLSSIILHIEIDKRAGFKGFTLETLQRFAENRRVDRLIIRWDGSRHQVKAIPNGDPNDPIMLTSCKFNPRHNPRFIHWLLNEDGYYITLSANMRVHDKFKYK